MFNLQLQGLEHDIPYTHSYKTLIKSQVLTLRLDDWAYLLQHFPKSRNIIYRSDTHDGGGGKGSGHDGNSPRLTRVRLPASASMPRTSKDFRSPPHPPTSVSHQPLMSPSLHTSNSNPRPSTSKSLPPATSTVPPSAATSSSPPPPLPDTPLSSQSSPKYLLPHQTEQQKTFMDKSTTSKEILENTFNLEDVLSSDDKSKHNEEVDVLRMQEKDQATTDLIKQFDETEIPKKVLSIVSTESLRDEKDMVNVDITRQPQSKADVKDTNFDENYLEEHNQNEEIKLIFSDQHTQHQSGNKILDNVENDARQTPLGFQEILLEHKKEINTDGGTTAAKDKPQSDTSNIEQPTNIVEDTPVVQPETSSRSDHATSTSKIQRQTVRIRYEEDTKSEPKENEDATAEDTHRRTKSYGTVDSEIHIDKTSEPDEDQEEKPSGTADTNNSMLPKEKRKK